MCGNSRGIVTIVDFETFTNFNSTFETYPLNCKLIHTRKKSSHQHMVNGSQWYPVDTTIFVTTGMDKLLKVFLNFIFKLELNNLCRFGIRRD